MSLIWRVLYRLYRIFSSLRYWLPRRFAPAGLAVFGALVITAMVGVDTENTVAYQGFALLLFLLLVAIGFSCFFRLHFSATRVLPRFGTVGQPLSYRIVVR